MPAIKSEDNEEKTVLHSNVRAVKSNIQTSVTGALSNTHNKKKNIQTANNTDDSQVSGLSASKNMHRMFKQGSDKQHTENKPSLRNKRKRVVDDESDDDQSQTKYSRGVDNNSM